MDRVLTKRCIVLWITIIFSPFIINIILHNQVIGGVHGDIISVILVYILPYILIIILFFFISGQAVKIIGDNKYSRYYVQSNKTRIILAIIATFLLMVYFFSLITPILPITPLIMIALLLYIQIFRVIYVGNDVLIFNNKVIKISDIEFYEAIDFLAIKGVKFSIKGKKYEVNFESKRARNYVIDILNQKKKNL